MKLLLSAALLCMTAVAQNDTTTGATTNDAQSKPAQSSADQMTKKHSSTKHSASTGSSQKFSRLSGEFMRESLALSPVGASQAGYHKHTDPRTHRTIELDAQLDDAGPAAIEQQRKFYARWQQRLSAEAPLASLNAQDAADWQLIQDTISLSLLELNQVHSYQHNPTGYVELIGNSLFLPLTQSYAAKEVRLGHVLSRMQQIPRFLEQAKAQLVDADPIYIKVAVEENTGNIDLIESDVKEQVAQLSKEQKVEELQAQYQKLAPQAIAALKGFSDWLQQDLGKRPNPRSWRLGKQWYDAKFKYVMETDVTPEQLLANAENDLKTVRAQMLEIALPLHAQMYPDHGDHADLAAGPDGEKARQNKIISEVLARISDDHVQRGQLIDHVKQDLDGITQFIREKKIVALSDRENLKVIPTPAFLRGVYSVAGFHQAPPLEPNAEAEYWVTPIDPNMPDDKAESKLREYNNWTLKWLTIHEALPGHYIQFEHANSVQPAERRLLRAVLGNGAYIEGWAEYVAQVMMDEGFLDHDPRFVLSMKKIRLRLLSNTILDVRMQTMNMSDDEALDLMMNSAFQTRAEAEGKLQRAKLTSTQLPTYYVGINEWWRLRKKYEAAQGDKFNLMDFHNQALDQGPLPIPLLEKILLPAKR